MPCSILVQDGFKCTAAACLPSKAASLTSKRRAACLLEDGDLLTHIHATCRAPCSKIHTELPTLAPGLTPGPPQSPATMLVTRLPYRLGVTCAPGSCSESTSHRELACLGLTACLGPTA